MHDAIDVCRMVLLIGGGFGCLATCLALVLAGIVTTLALCDREDRRHG